MDYVGQLGAGHKRPVSQWRGCLEGPRSESCYQSSSNQEADSECWKNHTWIQMLLLEQTGTAVGKKGGWDDWNRKQKGASLSPALLSPPSTTFRQSLIGTS